MKQALSLLLAALLGMSAGTCGGARDTNSVTRHAVLRDRDNDDDNNDDDAHNLNYGHAPTAPERRQLTSLVRAYYATAAAGEAAKACSMLYSLVSETLAEYYGNTPGSRGNTCATVIAKLFGQRHRQLVEKSNTLKIYAIRVRGERALVLLSFATAPEVRQIEERRASGAWKLTAISDTILE